MGVPFEMYLVIMIHEAAIGAISDLSCCHESLKVKSKAAAVAGVVEDSSAKLCFGTEDTGAEWCKARFVEIWVMVL